MLGGGDSPFRGMVVAALAFLVWDILITTDEEVILLPGLIPVALETDLVSWKGQIRMAVRPCSSPSVDIGLINCSDVHGHTTKPFISSYDMYLSW